MRIYRLERMSSSLKAEVNEAEGLETRLLPALEYPRLAQFPRGLEASSACCPAAKATYLTLSVSFSARNRDQILPENTYSASKIALEKEETYLSTQIHLLYAEPRGNNEAQRVAYL